MKLVLVIPAMTAGGAERVMTLLANDWAARDREVVLLTLDDGAAPPFFPLDARVRHRPLAVMGDSAHVIAALANNARRLRALRRAIDGERPDAVLSFLDSTNVLTLLATRGLGIPVIASEHIDPAQYHIKHAWNLLRRWVYPMAERVVVLTERAGAFFPATLQRKLAVVPNPVVPPPPGGEPGLTLPAGRWLVAMGRLTEQKGFDILLWAFATLSERHPEWRLAILGEGPLRADLEALRDELGLADRVLLPGRVGEPKTVLEQADLFVLPSRFEGFPMALCEAMAAGLPVVAADCPTGPREIIRDGEDGLLVPPEDPTRLASALERLMTDPAERSRLAARAPEVAERYSLRRIMDLWDALLAEAIADARVSRATG